MSQRVGSTRNQIGALSRRVWATGVTIVGAGLVTTSLVAAPAAEAAMPGCTVAALSALGVPDVTIISASDVAAVPPNPEYCRVRGSVASPSGNPSGDGFALDLPRAGTAGSGGAAAGGSWET